MSSHLGRRTLGLRKILGLSDIFIVTAVLDSVLPALRKETHMSWK